MLYITSWVVPGFSVHGFWDAVLGTIVIWLVNVILRRHLPDRRPEPPPGGARRLISPSPLTARIPWWGIDTSAEGAGCTTTEA